MSPTDLDRSHRRDADTSQQIRFYEAVLSTITDFAYLFDLDGRFRYANKPLLDLWGLTLEQAVGKNFFDLRYPPDLAAKLQRQIQEVIDTGQRVVDETPYTSETGAGGFYEYIFSPVFARDGSIEGVAGSTREISARKRLEVERDRLVSSIEYERSRLATIVEHAPALICTLRGPDHVFELANELYYANVGKRDIIGRPIREALPELEGQVFFDLLDNVYRTGETFVGNDMPVQLRRTPGGPLEHRFVNVIYQPMRESDGSVSGILVHGVDVTEIVMARREIEAAERRLRTSEERLAFSVEAAELGTFYCPLPFSELQWNAKCKEHFWLPPDADVDIELFFKVLHPDDRDRTRRALEHAIANHTGYDVEYRTVAPDGRQRWVRAIGRPFFDPSGTPTRFDGVTMDITQRKLSEGRDRLLVSIDDAVRSLNDPAEVTATFARMLGEHIGADRCAYADVEADQDTFNLIGDFNRGVPSIVGRYRFIDFGAEVLELMRADKPYVVEDVDTHQPPVGDLSAYRQTMIRAVICVPLHKAGRFVAAMAVHQTTPRKWTAEEVDLVWSIANRCWESIERVRIERELRESEAMFRTMADVMPQMIWITRPDGFHEYFNKRWYEFTGVPEGSTDGEGWSDMFHPDDRGRAWKAWRHSLATGDSYEVEYRLRHRSGEYRWTLGRALPVRNERGEIERWFGTCTDIDAMKRLTDERESVLASERAARAEAERAGRMKDEFLATLSHELRTPMNAIVGWAQILRNGRPSQEDLTEGLSAIDRNARAQTQIIEDLLDMSRIVSGKIRLDVQRVDLPAVVQSAVDTMRPAADAKGIALQALIDPSVGQIGGDPGRLHQVFWNLISNSIKFTPRGGRVRVLLERVASQIEVSVIDTGEGIRPEFLPHVFDRFRQQDASTTRRHGGLGLGLSIVKQLVELHGGTVRAHSAGLGHGTTFVVALPPMAVRGQPTDTQRESMAIGLPADLRQHATEQLKDLRVLVVDDEVDARTVVQRLLEGCSAIVTTAANASEALSMLEAEKPDILISDIGMPGEDGYSLIRKVRSLHPDSGGQTPALALTAYARAEDRVRAVRAGFQTHVVKPVEPAELITMVASLAGRTSR